MSNSTITYHLVVARDGGWFFGKAEVLADLRAVRVRDAMTLPDHAGVTTSVLAQLAEEGPAPNLGVDIWLSGPLDNVFVFDPVAVATVTPAAAKAFVNLFDAIRAARRPASRKTEPSP